MKRLIKFGAIGIVAFGAIVGEANALVDTFTNTLPVTGYSVFTKGAIGELKSFVFTGGTYTKTATLRTNACGFTTISNPSAYTDGSLNVGGVFINVAATKALAAINEPLCNPDGTTTPAFIGSSRAYHLGKGAILVRNLPSLRVVDASWTDTSPLLKEAYVGETGYATASPVSQSAQSFHTSVSINGGAPVLMSSLPTAYRARAIGGNLLGQYRSNVPLDPALGVTPPASVARTDKNNLVFTRPDVSPFAVKFIGQNSQKAVTTNRCGGFTLGSVASPVSGTIQVNGFPINLNALQVAAVLPKCVTTSVNGSTSYNDQGVSKRTAAGQAYIVSDEQGLALSERQIIEVGSTADRNVTLSPNGCKVAAIASTSLRPILDATTFNLGGTVYTVGALPVIVQPSCDSSGQITTIKLN